ncbi:MAG: acyl-ACP--UDP-N-acetylglucosamine O-acyltransferase [Coraliomargaritaceae bacterium]
MEIHPTALIAEDVTLGEGCRIGPYAVVESGAVLGRACRLSAHSIVRRGALLGDSVQVDSFSVVGGDPQSIGFDVSTESRVVIGSGVILREGVTIHRPETAGAETVVGDDCFLMAQSHVAHDCHLGEGVIVANNVMLAGHVTVGARSVFGGGAGIHQHCRIGAYSMIAGNASITADVPPYVMAAERSEAHGLNLVGLRRGPFDKEAITDLKRCYRAVFFGGGNLRKKAADAAAAGECGQSTAGQHFLTFFAQGKRGFVQSTRD